MQECILSFNNREEVLELPVPLQEWEEGDPQNTYTFSTMETGDVLAIGSKKLQTLTIESFFPATKDYTFLINKNFPDPFTCVETIKRWRATEKPIRVVITGTDVNLAMAIEDFRRGKADNTEDVYFTLELVEYTFLNVPQSKRTEEKKKQGDELNARPNEKQETKTTEHKVRKGDTLWDMAEKYLGDGNKWKEIAKLNKIKNGFDMKVGQNIKIPPKDGQDDPPKGKDVLAF